MKFLHLLALLLLASCAQQSYQHIYESSKVVDFRKGKWLVNYIEVEMPIKSEQLLTDNLLKGLEKVCKDSVYFVDDAQLDYLSLESLKFEVEKETFEILSKTTDFNYLINTKAIKISDDLGNIMFTPPSNYKQNRTEVIICIYEIQTGEKIYSQKIFATTSMDENDDDINFAKSANRLIFSSFSKGLKQIKKYAIINE